MQQRFLATSMTNNWTKLSQFCSYIHGYTKWEYWSRIITKKYTLPDFNNKNPYTKHLILFIVEYFNTLFSYYAWRLDVVLIIIELITLVILNILGITGDEASRGNYGLLDQVEVLKWVQTNIAGKYFDHHGNMTPQITDRNASSWNVVSVADEVCNMVRDHFVYAVDMFLVTWRYADNFFSEDQMTGMSPNFQIYTMNDDL